jgi:hypothetical protein
VSTATPTLPASRRATAIWAALFAVLCLFAIIAGLETALHFLGSAIDGPFQLYNSLRRILAGQHGGVDFQFFHGLGIPYLHYIPFRLLGGNFIASEISRELVSSVLYPVSVVLFLKFFIRDWPRALAWSAVVMAVSFALRLSSVIVAINSLLGVRSTLPILLPIALCLPIRRSMRTLVAGLVVGGALVLGTEQGLATILALGIATLVAAFRSRDRSEYLVDSALIAATGIATLLVVLTTIGGMDGARRALTYNFRLVPMDQYWYFGAPPNLFLSSWRVIPRMMMSLPRIPIALCVGIIAVGLNLRWLWRDANAPRAREQFAFTVLALYGLISCASLLGTYVHAYVQPLIRVLLLLGAVQLDRFYARHAAAHPESAVLGVSRSLLLTVVASMVLMFVVVPGATATIVVTIPHVVRDHMIKRVGAVYMGIWPETIVSGQSVLDARRDSNGRPPSLWSTYSGLLEARNGLFHPSVDYIIHALGPGNRRKYVDDFRRLKPRLVQTASPLYTQYETWIEDTSWDFYVELLQHYKVVATTPWSIFWERSADSAAAPPPFEVWSSKVAPGADRLQLPVVPVIPNVSPLVLVQVEIDYTAKNAMHSLPIIGAIPRYLVRATDVLQRYPVTIDPYTTTTRFPLLAIRGKAPVLSWSTASLLPGARLEVTAVRLFVVQTSPTNEPWMRALVTRESGQEP